MTEEEIKMRLIEHKMWIEKGVGCSANLSKANLSKADLSGANLSRANLSMANLSGANLSMANLSEAKLSKAKLSVADLSWADLSKAKLSGANLSEAKLYRANLSGANLSEADLSKANLSMADLSMANLSEADLSGTKLSGADLSKANLSKAKGVQTSESFMSQFNRTTEGVVVFKRIGNTNYSPPSSWALNPGSVISEVVNPYRTTMCGCGVNFGTLKWCNANYQSSALWKCLIRWIDLADVVVPFGTDGKARCGRMTLLEKVNP